MPKSRNRAQARRTSRRIDQDLQGAQDALIAFEGYGTNGPMLHASALQRPAARRPIAWFERAFTRLHQLFVEVTSRDGQHMQKETPAKGRGSETSAWGVTLLPPQVKFFPHITTLPTNRAL